MSGHLCACPICGEDTHDGRVCDECAAQARIDDLMCQLRAAQEAAFPALMLSRIESAFPALMLSRIESAAGLTNGHTTEEIIQRIGTLRADHDDLRREAIASHAALNAAPGVVKPGELSFRCGDAGRLIGVLIAERDEARAQRDAARNDRDEARGHVLDLAHALECKGLTPADHGSVHVAALRAARDVVDELRRSGAPDGLDVRRRVVWLREQLIAAAAERDSAIGELNTLRRERETLIAERDDARADHYAERELRREALAEVKRMKNERESRATPGLLDGANPLRALLDDLGVPLSEHSDAVRVAWVVGRYGAAGGGR